MDLVFFLYSLLGLHIVIYILYYIPLSIITCDFSSPSRVWIITWNDLRYSGWFVLLTLKAKTNTYIALEHCMEVHQFRCLMIIITGILYWLHNILVYCTGPGLSFNVGKGFYVMGAGGLSHAIFKAAVTRAVFRWLVGDCHYCALRNSQL